MDLGRILGAVLSGAATRPARRTARRGSGPFGMTQTQTRSRRLVGTLATIAAEALSRRESSRSTPGPVQRRRRAEPPPRSRSPPPAPPPPPSRNRPQALPAEPTAEASVALLLLRAMIAAARADGELDRAERSAIATQLDSAGLTAPERDHVLADFDRPATVEELARQARDPMLAAQLYAAACAVTSAGAGQINPAERAWLDRLGTALKLDQRARAAIEARLAA
jgi:uncharacterized membrane protein YebE (DUF533 family)